MNSPIYKSIHGYALVKKWIIFTQKSQYFGAKNTKAQSKIHITQSRGLRRKKKRVQKICCRKSFDSEGSSFIVDNNGFIIDERICISVKVLTSRLADRYDSSFIISHTILTLFTEIDLQKQRNSFWLCWILTLTMTVVQVG